MKDLAVKLQAIEEFHRNQLLNLIQEEKALMQEVQYLEEKALLGDGKVVSSLEFFYVGAFSK